MPPRRYQPRRGPRPQRRRTGPQGGTAVAEPTPPRPTGPVEVPPTIAVKDLAGALAVSHADIIKELIRNGIFATINQTIDYDTASLVAGELGFETVEKGAAERAAAAEEPEKQIVRPGESAEEAGRTALWVEDDPSALVERAPVVTVMGHVDHGKTSLLDAVRRTKVAAGERGGITQHIGASEVVHNDRRIVFLDTPGHEAFTAMRARGAQVTDIAVIVVAADDGVMPQTREAIDHVRAARVPMVVAINKVDKPDATPDRVKQELADIGVLIEEYGGDVPEVEVSAKQELGIDELMEVILLVADLQELRANPKRPAIGTIVESQLDRGRGPVATVLVQTGTLRAGDVVVAGKAFGRVRAMTNAAGRRVKAAEPASAVEILGLNEVPQAGDILRVVPDEKEARERVSATERAAAAGDGRGAMTLEDISAQIQAAEVKELRVVLKTDVQGSLGAIRQALERLNTDEARVNILREGAGDINESDVLLAAASEAVIIGFNTRLDPGAQRAVDASGVDVRTYDVIYKLTDDIGQALRGLLAPKVIEQVEGHAEVRAVIRAGRTLVAGSYVTDGRIVRGGQARLFRGGQQIAETRIESLRRFKDDVREVAAGYECGIGLADLDDIAEGDVVECFQMVSEPA